MQPALTSVSYPPIRCRSCATGYYKTGETSQRSCQAGYYCPGSCRRYGCQSGKFSTGRATACTNWSTCYPGKYQSTSPSSTRNRGCSNCASGTYSSVNNAAACSSWRKCNAGYYTSRSPTASSDRVCRFVGGRPRGEGKSRVAQRAVKTSWILPYRRSDSLRSSYCTSCLGFTLWLLLPQLLQLQRAYITSDVPLDAAKHSANLFPRSSFSILSANARRASINRPARTRAARVQSGGYVGLAITLTRPAQHPPTAPAVHVLVTLTRTRPATLTQAVRLTLLATKVTMPAAFPAARMIAYALFARRENTSPTTASLVPTVRRGRHVAKVNLPLHSRRARQTE